MNIQFIGAAGEVTGSCHLIQTNGRRVLLDCGLIQGSREDEARNKEPFPFEPHSIDAVVLSHAHIDHSGRIPLLVKGGFKGRIYAQKASVDLCRIMLRDAGYLNEKEAEWENRRRQRKGRPPVAPLYGMRDATRAMRRFTGIAYGETTEIVPGLRVRLSDAGHILGSAIVEAWMDEAGQQRKLVYSGDLGQTNTPILKDPSIIRRADMVLMESTYGDRLHRSRTETEQEMHALIREAVGARGNILIPAFAVGRSQEVLYLLAKHYQEWGLDQWEVFLDSPMAIDATEVYMRHNDLYDREAAELWRRNRQNSLLPNLHFSRTANQSMRLNRIRSGAIIIAGSGMCTGGRIRHHLKHNLWRKDCHIVIVGFQARGTLGRALVDGAEEVRLWGETIRVGARVHTVGGLSAHADQTGLMTWYQGFENGPRVTLVHGEEDAIGTLAGKLRSDLGAPVHVARPGERLDLLATT